MGIGAIVGSISSAIGSGIGNAAGGIEGGGVVGAVGATSISGLARFDTGPSLNSMFGPKMGSIVPEGINLMGAKNFGTLDLKGGTSQPFSPVGGEILFRAKPEKGPAEETGELVGGTVGSKVGEAVGKRAGGAIGRRIDELIKDRQVAPMIMPRVEPMAAPWVLPMTEPMAGPVVEAQPKLQPATKTESRVFAAPAQSPAVLPQPARIATQSVAGGPLPEEQEVEEVVEEKVKTQEPKEDFEEEVNKVVRKHVVDDGALSRVVVEIKHALVKAQEFAKKSGLKLTGALIGKFMPGQHPGNESEVVKGGGQDGSIPERQQSIEELGELSGVQAEGKAVNIAYEKPPIKIRSEGKQVGDEDIQRVYKDHRIKPKALIEVVTRVIKKKKLVAQTGQKPVEAPSKIEVPGNKIEDYPQLDGVFPKAA